MKKVLLRRVLCPKCGAYTKGLSYARHLCGNCKQPHNAGAIYTPTASQQKQVLQAVDYERLAASLLDDIRGETKPVRAIKQKPVPVQGRHLLELAVMDVHIGKLSWAQETGANYDLKIASERAETAVLDLLHQASNYNVERIVLPWGNDFFHYDTLEGETTAGTIVDRDSRYHKMFRSGRALASRVIKLCAEVAPTEVIVIPGNHDELSAFLLGEVLDAQFSSDERVTVDNRPRLRKYLSYGANLIGFTHGKEEPLKNLPLIMATEEPVLWGASQYREFHTGHRHKARRADSTPVESQNGVRVRTLESLSSVDEWHARQGYVGEPPAAEAFVWNYSRGLRANYFHLVL